MARHLVLLVAVLASASASGQGTRRDYERALGLHEAWPGKVLPFPAAVHWLPEDRALWFQRDLPGEGREFVVVDCATGQRRPAFDARTLADVLGRELGCTVDPTRLPIDLEDVAPDGSSVVFRHNDRRYRFAGENGALAAADDETPRLQPRAAPRPSQNGGLETTITLRNGFDRRVRVFWIDAEGHPRPYGELAPGEQRVQHTYAGHVWLADFAANDLAGIFVAQFGGGRGVIDETSRAEATGRTSPPPARPRPIDAFLRDHQLWGRADGSEFPLSTDGRPEDRYEEPLVWSPDGTRVLCLQTEPGDRREVTLVESSPEDQVQPRLQRFPYPKPGDRIDRRRPRLFDVVARRPIAIEAAPFADAGHLDDFHWAPDGRRIYGLYTRRGHQLQRVYAIDAESGAVTTVVEERSDTFIDTSQKTWWHWLDATSELLWASERSGWNHLYRVDLRSGATQPITGGEWVVRRVERVDAAAHQIWFWALGLRPGQDPYYAHLARANFDGTGLTVLTEADGTHEGTFSPGGRFLIDRWSRVDQPWVTELRRTSDGSLVAELGRDDASPLLAAGFRPPERFVSKGRDGRTDIYGLLLRPSNFQPSRRYAVIESIYAGPQSFHVPASWSLGLRERTLAELGFIVAMIDGMGTNWRSKSFHDVCWQNLKDAGLPDHIAWLRAAAAAHPEMDLSRVGIFGGSAGGQNALAAVLHHGDFYRAAAADCGCHDNRLDKLWWNEAWMGWPVGPHYAENSNVTHAPKLSRPLLLTVGELDRNVDPASTLQVVRALIKADKDFELVIVPGAGHGVGESGYLARRRMDFFVRHLLGVEPRRE